MFRLTQKNIRPYNRQYHIMRPSVNLNFKKRKRRGLLRRLPPEDSQKVQSLGSGSLLTRVTIPYSNNFSITANENPVVNIISLGNLIESNPEFTDKQYNFKYYKIIAIKLIKFPNNNSSALTHFIVYLDWGARNTNYTYEYMTHADTVKRIPFYNFKVMNFKFKPPNANLPTSNSQASYINLRNFNSTYDQFTIPINLAIVPFKQPNTNVQTAYVNFTIEVLIQFRGSEYYSDNERINNMIKNMNIEELNKLENNIKKQKEEKDDEIKEEEEEEEKEEKNKSKSKSKNKNKNFH